MSTEPVLRLEAVKKAYNAPEGGRVEVLDVERFEVARGEQVALRGSSGSGKTTLLHIIAGLIKPDAGAVHVAGADVARLGEAQRDHWRAKHVGYIYQSFHLLQGFTALENIALAMKFGGRVDLARAKSLLEQVGLGARLNYKPRQLSIGQQQRVAVARALANTPALVLADEPTGNLDREHADAALELILSLCKASGAALLLVSHDERVVARFARVVDLATLNRRAAAGARA
ncbi:MAG: ABC transporter ATP-binding protein [Planctomycetes bacterium]|nr:ABC transporter ATP-binding protein [Planctomycetota bacterium]